MSVKSNHRDGLVQVATMITPDLFDLLAETAKRNERSLAAELRLAIRNHLRGSLNGAEALQALKQKGGVT